MTLPEMEGADGRSPLPKVEGYALEREIGRGSYAVVYRARQEATGRSVAVKLLTRDSGRDESATLSRFQREARLLAEMSDPGIVEYLGAGTASDGTAYIVMEHVEGRNLREWVEEKGRLGERDGVLLLGALARALQHAHERGVMHRDVKPENILLDATCGQGLSESFPVCPKVADLGLARYERPDGEISITMKGSILGTPSVMAPEQFRESGKVDHRTDIYALGCVVFYAIAGQHAFAKGSVPELVMRKVNQPAPRLSAVLPGVSPALDGFLARMMAPEPEARIQDYARIVAFCEDFASDRASPPSEVALPVAEVLPPEHPVEPGPPASPAGQPPAAAPEGEAPPGVAKGPGCLGAMMLAAGLGVAVLLAVLATG